MQLRLLGCAALVGLISLTLPAHGLGKPDPFDRPKIGLVLGGGGARGGAHIGVLKLIEEYRVPVDVIVGTSFGAFVGALYASGLGSDEIEQLVLNADLQNKFMSNIPRDALSFRRKRDDDESLVKYRLGIKDGKPQFPRGIVSGQEFRLWLDEVLFEVRGVDNFDDLPIPFRAVTTDIVTGEQIVMGEGVVTTAIYASMAVPGLLPPAEQEDRLLVDGGLVNNLPVDVARDLGADIVIAVDVGTLFATRDELDSALSILDQVTNVLVRGNSEKTIDTLRRQDILIQPNLGTVSTLNFERLGTAITAGTEAAWASGASSATGVSSGSPMPAASTTSISTSQTCEGLLRQMSWISANSPSALRSTRWIPLPFRITVMLGASPGSPNGRPWAMKMITISPHSNGCMPIHGDETRLPCG
jgi:predicted acylesterase/phospholipase RssA